MRTKSSVKNSSVSCTLGDFLTEQFSLIQLGLEITILKSVWSTEKINWENFPTQETGA